MLILKANAVANFRFCNEGIGLSYQLIWVTLCRSGVVSVTNGQVTCVAREMVMRQASECSDGGKSEAGSSPHS